MSYAWSNTSLLDATIVRRVTSTMYVVLVLAFGLSREDHCIVINGLIKPKIFSVSIKYRVIFCQIILNHVHLPVKCQICCED